MNVDPGPGFELRSEFAVVGVRLDRDANGDRLEITDLRTGNRIHLDPLELERLTAASHHDLEALMRPAF